MKKIYKTLLITLLSFLIFNLNIVYAKNVNTNIIIEKSESSNIHLLDETEIENIGDCESILGDPEEDNPATPAYYLSFVFSVMRYAAIIILLVMTVVDFLGALTAQDNDLMRKAIKKLGSRAIMCVIIFLLPTIIDLVLKFLHNSQVSDCIDLTK